MSRPRVEKLRQEWRERFDKVMAELLPPENDELERWFGAASPEETAELERERKMLEEQEAAQRAKPSGYTPGVLAWIRRKAWGGR